MKVIILLLCITNSTILILLSIANCWHIVYTSRIVIDQILGDLEMNISLIDMAIEYKFVSICLEVSHILL